MSNIEEKKQKRTGMHRSISDIGPLVPYNNITNIYQQYQNLYPKSKIEVEMRFGQYNPIYKNNKFTHKHTFTPGVSSRVFNRCNDEIRSKFNIEPFYTKTRDFIQDVKDPNNESYSIRLTEDLLNKDGTQIHTKKLKLKNIDIEPYNVRFGISLEEYIDISTLDFDFDPSKYRTKDRRSFFINHYVKIDLTVIDMGSTKEIDEITTLNDDDDDDDGEVTKNGKTYEIEIELLYSPNMNYNQSLKSYQDIINIINKIVQGTNIVWTNKIRYETMKYYNQVLGKTLSTLDISSMSKARNLQYRDLVQGGLVGNPRHIYRVTHKADGVRKFMFFSSTGIWFLNPPDEYNLISKKYIEELDGVILDGELIPNDPTKRLVSIDAIYYYLIFDCLSSKKQIEGKYIANNDIQNDKHNDRLFYAQYVCDVVKNRLPSKLIAIETKKFYTVADEDRTLWQTMTMMFNEQKRLPYKNDGLIFTDNESQYNPRLNVNKVHTRSIVNIPDILKWKPSEENSIDLAIKREIENGKEKLILLALDTKQFFEIDKYGKTRKRILKERIPFNGSKYNPAKSDQLVDLSDPIIKDFFNNIPDGTVVEFRWEKERERFIPQNIRYDKIEPNHINVAMDNWDLIYEPITQEILEGGGMKLVFRYHNRIKRSLFNSLFVPKRSTLRLIFKVKESDGRGNLMMFPNRESKKLIYFVGTDSYNINGDHLSFTTKGDINDDFVENQDIPLPQLISPITLDGYPVKDEDLVEYGYYYDRESKIGRYQILNILDPLKYKADVKIEAEHIWDWINYTPKKMTTSGPLAKTVYYSDKFDNKRFSPSPHEYRQSTNISSRSKRVLKKIDNETKGLTLLDIGSGQGGDVNKWKNFSKIVAVEPNPEFVRILRKRIKFNGMEDRVFDICTGGENHQAITDKVNEVIGDKVDVISLMLSLTFFWQSENLLNHLCKTISQNLKSDGKIIFMTADGNLITEMFNPVLGFLSTSQIIMENFQSFGPTSITFHPNGFPETPGRPGLFLDIPESKTVINQKEWLVSIYDLILRIRKMDSNDDNTVWDLTEYYRADKEKLLPEDGYKFTQLYSFGIIEKRQINNPTKMRMEPKLQPLPETPRVVEVSNSPNISQRIRKSPIRITDKISKTLNAEAPMDRRYQETRSIEDNYILPLLDQDDKVQLLTVSWTDDTLVRIGTIAEGSCYLHSIMKAYNKHYQELKTRKEREYYIKKLRRDLALYLQQPINIPVTDEILYNRRENKYLNPMDPINAPLDPLVDQYLTIYENIENIDSLIGLFSADYIMQGSNSKTDLKGLQSFMNSNCYMVEEVMSYITNTLGVDIYIMTPTRDDLLYYSGFDYAKDRPSVVILYVPSVKGGIENHYELLGRKLDYDQYIQTWFEPNDPLIIEIKKLAIQRSPQRYN